MTREKHHKIDADVAAILRSQVTCDGNKLVITGERLDPTMYQRVNKTMELLGGKWSRKDQAHVFDDSPESVIATALGDGKVLDRKQTYQFFQTPRPLAFRMAGLAKIQPGHRVLEPSAGSGSIAAAIRKMAPHCILDLVEIDPEHQARLLMTGANSVIITDFLRSEFFGPIYDAIVMNPPFTGYQDVAHVRHAYGMLKPGGRLVAIMASSAFDNSHKTATDFRDWLFDVQVDVREDLPPDTFRESGTGVRAKLIVLHKPAAEGRDEA